MRSSLFFCLSFLTLIVAQSASAQSTISDQPLELNFGKGLWGVLLPGYELGTSSAGGPAFHDSLDDVGLIFQLDAVRRFEGTRTSLETKGFYAFAETDAAYVPRAIGFANPSSGAPLVAAGSHSKLDADVDHYGGDMALRDTWRTNYGGLSAGTAFSYMAFDQDFNLEYGGTRLFRENLDSDFLGGKALVGWDGCLWGYASNLDFAVGLYDLDTDYSFVPGVVTGARTLDLSETAHTFETTFTARTIYRGWQLGWTFGAMYISDMPQIRRPTGAAATLTTDDAATFTGMMEILL